RAAAECGSFDSTTTNIRAMRGRRAHDYCVPPSDVIMIPIRTDSPLRTTPWMNWFLILLNVTIFIAELAKPSLRTTYLLKPQNPQLMQFVTYAFLHANVGHLVGNMLFLYIFGNNVNDKIGNVGYLAFYLAGAVMAGVGYVAAETSPMLGASGAV